MQRVLCLRLPNWSRQRLRQNPPGPEQQQSSPPSPPPDPWRDIAALKKLARWCRRYSPVVGLEDAEMPESLLLNITGCAHLFGGEELLAALVVRDIARLKLTAYAAIADTIGAAWAAA